MRLASLGLCVAGLAGACFTDSGGSDTGSMCRVGTAGCPCTDGGGCDPGLFCTQTGCQPPGGATDATGGEPLTTTTGPGSHSDADTDTGEGTTVAVDGTTAADGTTVIAEGTQGSESSSTGDGPIPLDEPHVHLWFAGEMNNADFFGPLEPALVRQNLDAMCDNGMLAATDFPDHCDTAQAVISIASPDVIAEAVNNNIIPNDIPVTGPTDTIIDASFLDMLDDPADMTDVVALDASLFDAGVASNPSDEWWSGSVESGFEDSSFLCMGWATADGVMFQGRTGRADATDEEWIYKAAPEPCSAGGHHILCACWNEAAESR